MYRLLKIKVKTNTYTTHGSRDRSPYLMTSAAIKRQNARLITYLPSSDLDQLVCDFATNICDFVIQLKIENKNEIWHFLSKLKWKPKSIHLFIYCHIKAI